MNNAKREALEKAGFKIGTVQEFLGLSDWENQLVQLKARLSKTVRKLREEQNLTQQQVAAMLRSSQSRIAKCEAGEAEVSIDLLVRYLFAVGGSLKDLETPETSTKPARKKARARGGESSTRKKPARV
jgi:predicted XRE-type DNA-binding protein